ncbi:uncharacterized protein [Macrobrachium rosenbergii]|uniref:uncharacterized protein n=1 Tax=Macrobrachium rosenbergii TaxID=79674 RepID=UPI0034D78F2B
MLVQQNQVKRTFMINKKMPKLLNLYPEEERSGEDSSCAVRGNNIMLENEVSMPHNIICSELQADPVTSRHNEIISYTTPLVNTMFLPPLFLIRNTLPMNSSIPHQNTFLMGERIIDNHIMQDNTSATTIMDELKNMTDEITVPRKKKKHLSRLGKKYPEIFHLRKNVATNFIKPHNQKVNSSQLPLQNYATINNNVIMSQSASSVLTDHTLVLHQENRIQRLEDLVNLTEQMNATNTDLLRKENSNQYHTQNFQEKNKSCNVFWEILIGNEDSDGKLVNSISASLRNQSNIRNKGQRGTSSEIFLNNATPSESGEGNLKAVCDIQTLGCQQQQHRSKEGIAVEDYIKKFMWL